MKYTPYISFIILGVFIGVPLGHNIKNPIETNTVIKIATSTTVEYSPISNFCTGKGGTYRYGTIVEPGGHYIIYEDENIFAQSKCVKGDKTYHWDSETESFTRNNLETI